MNEDTQKPIKALFLEDVDTDAELEIRALKKYGLSLECKVVSNESDFIEGLRGFRPDIILSDYTLPAAFDGLSALTIARKECPDVPFLFVSGTIGEERAIEALRLGATDYLLKTNLQRFPQAVVRAIQEVSERAQIREAEKALRESEKLFSLFMRYLPGVATLKRVDGTYAYVNERWKSLFQNMKEPPLGRMIEEVWPSEISEIIRNGDEEVIETVRSTQSVSRLPTSGIDRYWLITRFPITDDEGKVVLIGSVGLDISEREEQKLKIFRLNRIHEILSKINAMIVWTQDREDLVKSACRIIVEHSGFPLVWIAPKDRGTVPLFSPHWDSEEASGAEKIESFVEQQSITVGQRMKAIPGLSPLILDDMENTPDPDLAPEALSLGFKAMAVFPLIAGERDLGTLVLYAREANIFDEEEVALFMELSRDISFGLDALEKTDRLNYLAYFDALTGLPNRALFFDRVTQALYIARQENRQVAILVLNVERLQAINDTMGRHVGDLLLRQIAERLKSVTAQDNSLARVRDDCFALIVNNLSETLNTTRDLQKSLLQVFQDPFPIGEEIFRIGIKSGIALYPLNGQDADTLFRNSCAALVNSRNSPERFLFYQTGMNERAAEALSLENRLHRALDEQQFVLYYQPKIDFSTGKIAGMEALLRWNDPETGVVPPGTFIPILEETGMILDVGEWAIAKALSDAARWRKKGLVVPKIAVNVSPIQLRHSGFVSSVEKLLTAENESSPTLEFEITESVIMENAAMNISTLRDLRAMNLSIAIDDFGTGYSSLSYISQLPVDSLKIDRSFILNMGTSADSLTIVSTIISLAHTLGLKVVAEGVEDKEQFRLLMLLKCDEFQGYLFEPPLPPEKTEALLSNGVFQFEIS